MKKTFQVHILSFVLLVLLLSACAPAPTPAPPTQPPQPTATVVPTNTPVPTSTPKPTRTPVPPTATVPAPDKALEFLDGVKVVNTDSFDNPSGPGWGFGAGTIKDGVLEVLGKNWNGLVRERSFRANEGIITDFAYTKGSVFEMLVDSGDWYTDPYKRFGVYMENNYPRVNVWAGKNGLGGANLTGNFIPKPDTTYSLMMVVLPGGEFLAVIWDPSDPAKTVYYHEKVGKNWTNLAWTFKIGADQGKILFDNYREIKFDSLK